MVTMLPQGVMLALALLCFILGALNISSPRVNFLGLGLAFLTLMFFFR